MMSWMGMDSTLGAMEIPIRGIGKMAGSREEGNLCILM